MSAAHVPLLNRNVSLPPIGISMITKLMISTVMLSLVFLLCNICKSKYTQAKRIVVRLALKIIEEQNQLSHNSSWGCKCISEVFS